MKKYQIGIDEAGRGPLAGPVSVGAVMVTLPLSKEAKKLLKEGRDSKQISEKERERIYELIIEAEKNGFISFSYCFSPATLIDNKGIVFAIQKALDTNIKKLKAHPNVTEVLLDGSLKAPAQFKHQKTIIKGDAKVPLIGLASIVAKVERDGHMKKISSKYPEYKFHVHKGYGTVLHRKMIQKYGLSIEHRRTWC